MFLYLAVQKKQRHEAFELASAQAYQTVRMWAITKSKKRMPKFADMIREAPLAIAEMSPARQRATLEVLAAQAGVKVTRRPKGDA